MIRKMLRWARITKAGSDDGQFAIQQMEYLGKLANGLIVFPYGLHGNVPADSLALMFAVGGDADNRAAIAWTPKDRPKLTEGEVAFYHPPTDGYVIWRKNGDLDISSTAKVKVVATGDVEVTSPTVNITGDVNIVGNTAFTGTVTANGKDISDTHSHTQGVDSRGDSQAVISGVI